jgi:hypothetical protein
MRILHATRLESGSEKSLEPELSHNQIGAILKLDAEATKRDDSLQAVLSAQVRKINFHHRGAATHDCNGMKKSQESRSLEAESSDIVKLTQKVSI